MKYTVQYVEASRGHPLDRLHVTGPGLDVWIAATRVYGFGEVSRELHDTSAWLVTDENWRFIERDMNSVCNLISANHPNWAEWEEWNRRHDLELILPELVACQIESGAEFRDYISGHPDEERISDAANPNRKYRLPMHLYGFKLLIEPCEETAGVQ